MHTIPQYPVFLSPLEVRDAERTEEGRSCWILTRPLLYRSLLAGRTICIPQGYCTDFASVPRLPLAYLLTGDTVHAPAVVHDWIISSRMLDRTVADSIFFEAMTAERHPYWRRVLMYWAVAGYTKWLLWTRGKDAVSAAPPIELTLSFERPAAEPATKQGSEIIPDPAATLASGKASS